MKFDNVIQLIKSRPYFKLFVFALVLNVFSVSSYANSEIDSLINLANQTNDACESAEIYHKISRKLIYTNIDSALYFVKHGITGCKRQNCIKQLADMCNTAAIIEFYRNNSNSAFAYLDSSITIQKKIGNKTGVANAIGNKATLYYSLGELDESLELQFEALRLYQSLKDSSAIATTLLNIGNIYSEQKDYEKSLITTSQAEITFENLNETEGVAMSCYNLAMLYKKMNQADSCLFFAKKSVALHESLGSPLDMAQAYRVYSAVLCEIGEYDSANYYIDNSIAILNQIGHDRYAVEAYDIKAKIHFSLGQYQKGVNAAELLFEAGIQDSVKLFIKDGAYWLMQNYEALGDFKKAYEYSKIYTKAKEDILNEESLNQLNRLKEEFDFELKEFELQNALDQKQILKMEVEKKNYYLTGLFLSLILLSVIVFFIMWQRKLVAKQRTNALEFKALRTQMNPHFIFNSLNSIQRMYVEGNIDNANEFMGDFADLMRKILENSNKNFITLQEELDLLKLYIELEQLRCKNKFDYEISLANDIDTTLIQIPPLIFQPFVENAIWHGILPKKDRGKITICITVRGKRLNCFIEDDGVGFKQVQSNFHEPNGIKITEQRIGNKITIDTKPNIGTKIQFSIQFKTK